MKSKGKDWSEEAYVLESKHGFHLSYSSSSKEILKDEHKEKLSSKEYKIARVKIEKVRRKEKFPLPPKEIFDGTSSVLSHKLHGDPVVVNSGCLSIGIGSEKEGNELLCLIKEHRKKKETQEKRKLFLRNLLGQTKEYLKSRKEKLHWKNFIPPFFIP